MTSLRRGALGGSTFKKNFRASTLKIKKIFNIDSHFEKQYFESTSLDEKCIGSGQRGAVAYVTR